MLNGLIRKMGNRKGKKVLILTTSFPRWQGDAVTPFVYELCERLSTKGHKIIILAPHDNGAKRKEVIGQLTIYRFRYFWPQRNQKLCYREGILPNLRRNPWLWIQVPLLFLSQLVNTVIIHRKEKIDIIHSHWVIPSGVTAWVCQKLLKKPFIVTVHGSDILPSKMRSLKYLLKRVLNDSNACTVNSKATAGAVQDITRTEKLEVIPMGVDLNVFHPVVRVSNLDRKKSDKVKEHLILGVGRLILLKGINYLIEAMPLVLESVPDARLIICGDGPERKNLEELISIMHVTQNVSFKGNIPHERLPDYYRDSAVFVLPSIVDNGATEALGVVLLEAMACGTAIVGSNVGGIPDIIINGENGLLVEQKNAQDLAHKIIALLLNDELRYKLSKNGLETVRERFSWEAIGERFSKLYGGLP